MSWSSIVGTAAKVVGSALSSDSGGATSVSPRSTRAQYGFSQLPKSNAGMGNSSIKTERSAPTSAVDDSSRIYAQLIRDLRAKRKGG